ncbi:hypothetical protein [Candidatus Profftia tarda]|uniref:hypothetical protein n=1 Tax=Candidatus Profftia tarda TaxID=1177216 RepID=UPI003B969E3C
MIIFPLMFVVISQQLLFFRNISYNRFNILLIDYEVFMKFHIHVDMVVWSL